MDFSTLCVHGRNIEKHDDTGAVSIPIFQTATFEHPAVGESTGYDYSRLQNPTREHLEGVISALEGAGHTLAFSTGMAAITALMELFAPGDHIIASNDLYGGSYRLFSNISTKNGIAFDFVDTSDLEAVQSCIKENTKAIFVETPTNPLMLVTDISAISQLAKEHDLLLAVDNTFLTPYYQKPISLGADIVIHSATKYLGGHNDTLAGFLVTDNDILAERLRFIFKTTGACLSPFDSWLIIRGIKTLAIRMDRQQESAMRIADWLCSRKSVTAVYYAGLPSHPQYEISKQQASGFGAMLSFRVDSEQTAKQILKRLNIIKYAESLGGVETLMTYPMLQTHADVPEQKRLALGIDEKLLRLSVGIEAVEDLISDLSQALEGE
ncbi:MAG TPA: PLP-dependent aspartate aminotransferase family protein [Oscillospiraceae bacterium]|nr:PLP-dependent aspartate aminotransferase family protein [Oscillospiraceae bacterium]